MNIDYYHKYPNQLHPQPAYVEIDPESYKSRPDEGDIDDGVNASINWEIGNAVPFDVYHGKVIRLSLDPCVDSDAVDELLSSSRFKHYVAKLCNGHTIEYDHQGSNLVGVLDESGEFAQQELENMLSELPTVIVWDPSDWLAPVRGSDELGRTTLEDVVVTHYNVRALELLYRPSEEDEIALHNLEEQLTEWAEENEQLLADHTSYSDE